MTRHELKEQLQHDHFTDAVSHIVSYSFSNRQVLIRWATVVIAALVIAGGAFWFASYRDSARQHDLDAALAIANAQVGPASEGVKAFPTEAEKRAAETKAFSEILAKYGGSRQALVAQYYLGTLKAQSGDPKGAESDLRAVAETSSECAPLAKIALAQLLAGQNKTREAVGLLQSLVNKPADLVSKSQAQVLLAQIQQTSNPQEAKKILQSLKGPGERPAVARAADQLSAELTK